MTFNFLIFFSIFLILYFFVNLFVFLSLRKLFFEKSKFKKYFNIIFVFLPFSFILAKVLENYFYNYFIIFLNYLGLIYLGILLYIILILLFSNLIILLIKLFKFKKASDFIQNYNKYILLFYVFLIFFIMIFGFYNAFNTKINEINIKIEKKIENEKKHFSILVASDLHLGIIINKKSTNKLVKIINEINPDLLVLPGDIIDSNLEILLKNNLGEKFKEVNSNIPIYGILGNHEYIGDTEKIVKYLEENNIKILRDNYILIDNAFYLIGREDLSFKRRNNKERKTLEEILFETKDDVPKIVLDHQPYKIQEVANIDKIDLQIGGHTHNGQLWPLNYIVKTIYEFPYGYKKINNTHFVISSGYGFWGPPLRIGSNSELILINLFFE